MKKMYVYALLLSVLLVGCEDEYVMPVPEIDRFEVDVNLADVTYRPLESAYGVVTLQGRRCNNGACGYKGHGLILFRYIEDQEIFAFDATCPANADCLESGVVAPNKDRIGYVKCARCAAEYSLIDGRSTNQKVKLRPYYVMPIPNSYRQYTITNR